MGYSVHRELAWQLIRIQAEMTAARASAATWRREPVARAFGVLGLVGNETLRRCGEVALRWEAYWVGCRRALAKIEADHDEAATDAGYRRRHAVLAEMVEQARFDYDAARADLAEAENAPEVAA